MTRPSCGSLPQSVKLDVEEDSALVIQCLWRRGLAKKQLRGLKKEKSEHIFRMVQSALFIQRCYRGHHGREKFKVIKHERAKWNKRAAELEVWAATKIQVFFQSTSNRPTMTPLMMMSGCMLYTAVHHPYIHLAASVEEDDL